MVRVVVDANVIVSAAFGGNPLKAVSRVLENDEVYLSRSVEQELASLFPRLSEKLTEAQLSFLHERVRELTAAMAKIVSFRQACVTWRGGGDRLSAMKLQRTKRGTKAGITKRLAEDKQRLAEWRKRKRPGERIPERFWQAALSYHGELPLYRISREFSLDYNRLKKLTSGLPACQETGLELTSRFVEAPWLGIALGPEGMVCDQGEGRPNLVLERPDGHRLRVEGQLPELGYVQGLVAVFCRG